MEEKKNFNEKPTSKVYIAVVVFLIAIILCYFVIDIYKANKPNDVVETEIMTETETESETEEVTESTTETELVTEKVTETELLIETELVSEEVTEAVTETEFLTEEVTEIETEIVTESESITESETETEEYVELNGDNLDDWLENAEEGDYVYISSARIFYISRVNEFLMCYVYDASETNSHIVYVYTDNAEAYNYWDLISVKAIYLGRRYSINAKFEAEEITVLTK